MNILILRYYKNSSIEESFKDVRTVRIRLIGRGRPADVGQNRLILQQTEYLDEFYVEAELEKPLTLEFPISH